MGQLRAHEHILEALRGQIADGTLGVGDRLPAERELAATMGVSRSSLREALRALTVLGAAADGDDAHHLEHADRLAHRRAGDPEAGRELALGRQAVADAEGPVRDLPSERLEDVLVRPELAHGRSIVYGPTNGGADRPAQGDRR